MLVGENYAGKNWHFDIATYGLSSSACLFFPTIICHVCSLHYYHCYVVLISCQIFTKWIVCPQYYYVYQVTEFTRVDPTPSQWTCENNVYFDPQQQSSVGLQSVTINKTSRYAEKDHVETENIVENFCLFNRLVLLDISIQISAGQFVR